MAPRATALAAGALFALSLALCWKYLSSKSPFDSDLDPDEEKEKKGADKGLRSESPSGSKDTRLALTGRFGAIPRSTPRRGQSPERNLFSVSRSRRRKNWRELIQPASVHYFSGVYQYPFCFGPSPGFFSCAAHALRTYFGPPGSTPNDADEPFDVSIRPDILRDKPLTRSALCLALQNQLRKFLDEPFREAVQSLPEPKEKLQAPLEGGGGSKTEPSPQKDAKVPLCALSLWDSGYGERVFEEIPNEPESVRWGAEEQRPDVDDWNRKLSDSSRESSDETVVVVLESEKRDDLELSESTNFGSDDVDFKFDGDDENITEDEEEIILFPEKQTLVDRDRDKNPDFDDDTPLDSGRESLLSIVLADPSEEEESPESTRSTDPDPIRVAFQSEVENGFLRQGKEMKKREEEVKKKKEGEIKKKEEEDIKKNKEEEIKKKKEEEINTEEEEIKEKNEEDIKKYKEEEFKREKEEEIKKEKEGEELKTKEKEGIKKEEEECIKKNKEEDIKKKEKWRNENEEDIKKEKEEERKKEKEEEIKKKEEGEMKKEKEEDIKKKEEEVLKKEKEEDIKKKEEEEMKKKKDEEIKKKEEEERKNNLKKEGEPIATMTSGSDRRGIDRGGAEAERSWEEWGAPSEEKERRARVGGGTTGDVMEGGESRDSAALVARGTQRLPRPMDRETGERSVAVEQTVTTETTFGEDVRFTSVSRLTLEGWDDDEVSESVETRKGSAAEFSIRPLPSSPRVDRLKGLLCRDEERRRNRAVHPPAQTDGEWDRLLRDVLASVSELERWERDVREDAEEQQRQHPQLSSAEMQEGEEIEASPKGETPTKVKSLRFKLDPDIFDVPSDDSFYEDDDDWKGRRRTHYRTFSSLEIDDDDEPVRLVSVRASVVPAGQKAVARPVGIDLRVRLTECSSKRSHGRDSPAQAKRRSPVSERGWCQELSPVTENVDWRETFANVESKPNGILKTPSPRTEPPVESPNPFRLEKPIETPKQNGWKPPEVTKKKPFLLPRKKFEPDPEAVERITGYRSALSKPPLPPPPPISIHKTDHPPTGSKLEQARKQYLDSRSALSGRVDGARKFQQFLSQARDDRARLVTSVPDLAAIERAVNEQWTTAKVDSVKKVHAQASPSPPPDKPKAVPSSSDDDQWTSCVQSCRKQLGRRSQSLSYLETDVDLVPVVLDDKCQSISHLDDEPDEALPDSDRDDLDDSGRAKSEHELRVERSLKSLPVPDWYRRSDKTKTGFLLGSSNNREKRGWAAVKSLASSTSSLASCGLRRPVHSLRSSRENIPWSRSTPDGPALSLALAKAFREPYLGWRARTPTSSGVSSSPPSWGATTTEGGVSFDGEDAFGRTTPSSEDRRDEPPSLDDTGADAVTVSMDTNDPVKLPGGDDTCDDIQNMSMDTCEFFDTSAVVPSVDEDPSSPRADTGDDIDNLSTDTTTPEVGRKSDSRSKRYSYSQSIYHSERGEEEEEGRQQQSDDPHKVVWIESSFVGCRTTTSIVVLPDKKAHRPASR